MRLRARGQAVRDRLRAVDRVSTLRLVTGGVGALLGVAVWRDALPASVLLAPLVAFAALVVVHERLHRALERARGAVHLYQAGLRRIDDAWAGQGVTGQALAPADHPYAADLDLFGSGSLFELLCTVRTAAGRRTLAAWLLGPAPLPVVRQRQAAVQALRERLDLREALALAGQEVDEGLDPAALVAWGQAPRGVDAARARRLGALCWGVPGVSLSLALGWGLLPGGPSEWAARGLGLMVIVTWAVGRGSARFVQRTQVGAERSARQLEVLARVLACLERERMDDPRLAELRAALVGPEGSASRAIRRLAGLLGWAEIARSQLLGPVAFMLLWSLRFALAIERWRWRHGSDVARWLAALGELEALVALSGYAFEHPDDPFPVLVDDGEPVLVGEGLGHPLLPAATCVRNPVELGGATKARIVSGSNMSGKSTYLRTVGVNVVLALAGAPVRAERLRLSALRIGATLRVEDSLQAGASRFFAEITRLRAVVALADEGPGALFLLDEILHGTNSHDRRLGGHAIIEGLLDRGALGLVTTHDLALAAGADDPRLRNACFEDELCDGALSFDYRLHDGVVRKSNALALMEAVGLPVPPRATAAVASPPVEPGGPGDGPEG